MKFNKKSFLYIIMSVLILVPGCFLDQCSDDELTDKSQVAAPSFSVERGTYYNVTISCVTEGATLRYTLDSSDPLTSATAKEAASGAIETIGYGAVIKAYAFKENYIDSEAVEFTVPASDKTYNVKYSPSGSVLNVAEYWITEKDLNGRIMKETYFSGNGADGKWFTSDDTESYYYIYNYNADNVTIMNRTKYAGGAAVEVFTYTYGADLKISAITSSAGDYFTYTAYVGDNAGTISHYNASAVNDYTIINSFNGSLISKSVNYSAPSVIASYQTYSHSDNFHNEYIITYTYDSNGKMVKAANSMQYGSDALDYETTYEYDTAGKITRETRYSFASGGDVDGYFLYTYDASDLLTLLDYYLNDQREFYYNYTYDSSGRLTERHKFNNADTEKEIVYYSYYAEDTTPNSGKLEKEIVKVNPGPFSRDIFWNLTIEGKVTTGGFYTIGGANYDLSGIRIGALQNGETNYQDVLTRIISVVNEIVDDVHEREFTSTGLVIPSRSNDGYCEIIITGDVGDLSNMTAEIKVELVFNNFGVDEIVLDGTITEQMEGFFDYTGHVDSSATFNGSFTGMLTLTYTDPAFSASEFITESMTVYTYGANGKATAVKYKDPGSVDSDWELTADNGIDTYTTYTYDGSGRPESETVCEGDTTTETYKFIYSYTAANTYPDTKTKLKKYGTYIQDYNSTGADAAWETGDDVMDYSIFQFKPGDMTESQSEKNR